MKEMRHLPKLGAISLILSAAALAGSAIGADQEAAQEKKPAAPQTQTQPAKPDAKKASTSEAKPVSTAKISIDPLNKDVGTVAKGEKIEAVFNVKNEGTQDLIISDARPSCGCTVASFDKTIKPGQMGKINASVDTKNFSGPITKTISVVSNDATQPQINLTIKAIVKPYVEIEPQQFIRFSAVKGDPADNSVILISAEKGFHPTVAQTAQPYVKAEITPAGDKEKVAGRAGDQYRLHVTLEATAPEGLLNVPIKIKTGVEKQPDLEVPVAGIVRARLAVTPAVVQFGNFTPGKDAISRNVIVTNNKPTEAVRVLKAESTIAGINAEVVPMTEGVNYTIVLKPQDSLKKGAFDGKVKIFTTDKEKSVIEIPVSGTVL
jgi:hypothetical protein